MDSGQPLVGILIFVMVIMALGIATVRTIKEMIQFYQIQSLILALVTLLTQQGLSVFVAVLPVGLALSIQALLARATLPETRRAEQAERNLWHYWFQTLPNQATPIWQGRRAARSQPLFRLLLNLGFTAGAYAIAFSLAAPQSGSEDFAIDRWSLAASMALVLLGLFMMSNKQDIISQIMGLLVMEHGMFLAAIKVITFSSLAIIFVISLFLYIIVTLTILIFLLPELHHASGSIEVEEQKQLKG